MPIDNLGKTHFSDTEITSIHGHLDQLLNALTRMSVNLDAAERRRLGKVGERNKLLINKVKDFGESQPLLQAPEIDWEEFQSDYKDRMVLSAMLQKVRSLEEQLVNIKTLRDYDNYTDALRDYRHAKYKNSFANQLGYAGKIEALKVFFPKTGKTKKP